MKRPDKCSFCGTELAKMDPDKVVVVAFASNPNVCICSDCVKKAPGMPNAAKQVVVKYVDDVPPNDFDEHD